MDAHGHVSVILPTLNAERFLSRALRSVHAQGSHVGEVLVVDGGSTDDTRRIARREGTTVLGGPGTTLTDAWNIGIHAARCSWIGFLDADDQWTSTAIASHFRAIACDALGGVREEAAASTGLVTYVQEDVHLPPGFRPDLLGSPRIGWMPGSTLVRAEVARGMGEFSRSLGIASDIEWIDRLRTTQRVVINREVVVRKSVRSDSVSMTGNRRNGDASPYSEALLRLARERIRLSRSRTDYRQ